MMVNWKVIRWMVTGDGDDQLGDEINFHVELLTSEYLRRGLTEREAYRRARVDFGGVEQIKECCRDVRSEFTMHRVSTAIKAVVSKAVDRHDGSSS